MTSAMHGRVRDRGSRAWLVSRANARLIVDVADLVGISVVSYPALAVAEDTWRRNARRGACGTSPGWGAA